MEADNRPSRKLCEKLGMRKEGVFREFVSFVDHPDGTPHYEDTCQYAILKKEWQDDNIKKSREWGKNDIRRAKKEDIPGLLRLLLQVDMVHHAARPDIFKGSVTKYDAAQLEEMLENDSSPVFVCVDGSGKVLGHAFCLQRQIMDDAVLTDIMVKRLCLQTDCAYVIIEPISFCFMGTVNYSSSGERRMPHGIQTAAGRRGQF